MRKNQKQKGTIDPSLYTQTLWFLLLSFAMQVYDHPCRNPAQCVSDTGWLDL